MAFPKGIRTRTTPDWFCDFLSQGGVGFPPGTLATTEFQAVTLFNNSTRGAYLHVWGFSSIISDADFFYVGFVTEPLGTLQLACSRVNPSLAAPPGQIYWLHNGSTPIPITPVGGVTGFGSTGGQASYPFYIVPANTGIVFATPVRSDEILVNCWFVPFLDVRGRTPI